MTITGDLSTRDFKDVERKGGPRVVTCYSDDDPTIKRMAKIFDALDHPLMGDPNCDVRPWETCVECMDCTARADLDYAMEAAVYEGFSAPGNEKFKHIVLTYHGSWTFALPTHQAGKPRWVRMVLMEHCEGEVMDKIMGKQVIPKDDDDDDDYSEPNNKYTLDYGKLPPEADRLSIMKQIIEIEIRMMWNVEISITPCNARLKTENIFVCNDGSVKFISFREAKVYRYLDETEDHPNQISDGRWDSGVPAAEMGPMKSPIERYWSKCFLEPFGRWLPEAWEKNEELANEWLIDTFGSEKELEKYEPIKDEWFWEREPIRDKAKRCASGWKIMIRTRGPPRELGMYNSTGLLLVGLLATSFKDFIPYVKSSPR